MKLSEQTVSLLKNFSGYQSELWEFKSGNRLSTISPQKNILVSEIPETFPSDFEIYDLNKTWSHESFPRPRNGNW